MASNLNQLLRNLAYLDRLKTVVIIAICRDCQTEFTAITADEQYCGNCASTTQQPQCGQISMTTLVSQQPVTCQRSAGHSGQHSYGRG